MPDNRHELSFYEGKKVEAVGYYQFSDVNAGTQNRYSCIQDIEVTTHDKRKMHFSYFYVQRSGEIQAAKPLKGDRIRFTAVVNRYKKRDRDTDEEVESWGLRCPEGVEVLGSPESDHKPVMAIYQPPTRAAPILTPVVPEKPKASPVAIMKAVKALTGQVDSEALVKCVPHLSAIRSAVEIAGGEQDFLELLELVK